MPIVLNAPAPPDPDDRDFPSDFVTEHHLVALGINPALVAVFYPWATELRALDGSRCWARTDLAHLLEGK